MTYRKTTIKEVARAAGTSTQTVSRVLNDRPDVADETRLRVLQVIDELGYTPSALARGMIRQRSLTIGMLFSRLNLNGSSPILDTILAEADRLGYTLLLKELPDPESDDPDPLIRSLFDYQVDGILWGIPQIGERPPFGQVKFPIPVVFVNTGPISGQTVVSLDYFRSGYMATQYLIEQGYQKIGFISGPLNWWKSRECKRGWETALREVGCAISEGAVVSGGWAPATGCESAARLFSQYPEVDAIFVTSSKVALGVLSGASLQKRRIPQELGVIAFDDATEAEFFSPPLTIVEQDYSALGRTAMQTLVQLIETNNNVQGSIPTQTFIEPSLVIRESTAAKSTKYNVLNQG